MPYIYIPKDTKKIASHALNVKNKFHDTPYCTVYCSIAEQFKSDDAVKISAESEDVDVKHYQL